MYVQADTNQAVLCGEQQLLDFIFFLMTSEYVFKNK